MTNIVRVRTFGRQSRDGSGGPAHHPGSPGAQPQGRLARPAPRLAHRLHRAVRLRASRSLAFDTIFAEGQRRYVESLSAYARQFLGQMDKPDVDFIEGLSPGGLDRPEVHVEEPALDRRHDHRGLRLPPPALRPRRPPALPDLRRPDRAADPAADRRPDPRARGGPPLPGAGPGDPRPQGRVRRAVPPAPDPGLLPGPGQRRDPPARRPAEARQAEEAHHRGRRRPARGQGVLQAPADRLGRDRAQPRRRAGGVRLRRPAREGPGPRAAVQREDGVPQRAPDRHRRARAALVLVQLALRRLPGLPRPRHPHGGRPRARRAQPAGHPRRGRDPAVEPGARRRLLPPADGGPRRGARLRPEHAVGGPLQAKAAELAARRARDQGPRRHPQPLRPAARLLRRVRGRPQLHRASPPRGRVRHQPGALRGLHARGAVPGLRRQPPQAGLDGGHPR